MLEGLNESTQLLSLVVSWTVGVRLTWDRREELPCTLVQRPSGLLQPRASLKTLCQQVSQHYSAHQHEQTVQVWTLCNPIENSSWCHPAVHLPFTSYSDFRPWLAQLLANCAEILKSSILCCLLLAVCGSAIYCPCSVWPNIWWGKVPYTVMQKWQLYCRLCWYLLMLFLFGFIHKIERKSLGEWCFSVEMAPKFMKKLFHSNKTWCTDL